VNLHPFLLILFAGAAAAIAGEAPTEVRTVETYVPYEEFMKVAARDPEATIMSLEEYRALVALGALKPDPLRTDSTLPAVKCAPSEVVYTAQAREDTARFDAAFKVTVPGKAWVRCDLGVLQNTGRITLDGQPGWVVIENGRYYLLLKGEGQHTGTLSFSLPLQREEDIQKLNGSLVNSATALLNLTVSGRATLIGDAFPVEALFDEATTTTRFSIALGTTGIQQTKSDPAPAQLSLSWKRKYDAQKSPPLLLAEQQIAYLLERANPAFNWQARVTVARRKTDELVFAEPPGGRIIRISGPNIHSWLRDGTNLRILLEKPVLGEIKLSGNGILLAPPGNFELGCPALKDARQDTRYIALLESSGSRIAVVRSTGMRELALNEQPAALVETSKMSGGQLARLFLIDTPDAKLTAAATPNEAVFDSQSVMSLVIDEKQVTLRGAFSIHPEQGRVYALRLTVPAPWKLTSIKERGSKRGTRAEMSREADAEIWSLALTDAADAAHPLELDAVFALNDPAWNETDWQNRALNIFTPSLSSARRSINYLGISVHPSIDVAFGEMPVWRTERSGALNDVGVSETTLRTGLVSETPGGELKLQLSHKTARGEYELISHVLTQEREVWVRSDIRLAVVDRAIDELVITLPPEAKDPLYIKGTGIKEIVAGPASTPEKPVPNQRRVRFNQTWQGVRILRIEYRADLAANTDVAIPDVRLEGNFDSRRRLVFQSAGVVKLDVSPGPSLLTASLEDTPEFAAPFRSGRALYAFTFAPGKDAGTYRTQVLERSPALRSLAREMNLTTTLDASGMRRTHAAFVLSYERQQYMSVKLPEDATLIALYVSDKSVRPVKGSAPGILSVPLPPSSVARVEMVYQRSAGPLGNFGAIEEFAPDLLDIPVGATNWNIHFPSAFSFEVAGGNIAPAHPREPHFFAKSFWAGLFSGTFPRWTAWETPPVPHVTRLNFGETQPVAPTRIAQGPAVQQLMADETRRERGNPSERIAGGLAIPEGAQLRAGKLGGGAHAVLSYHDVSWRRFSTRAVFLASILLALWLARNVSRRAALHYIGWGLLLGSLIPPALDWQSPLLMVPFCEGLSFAAFVSLLALAFDAIRRNTHSISSAPSAASAALLAFALISATTLAGEGGIVLIPYTKDDIKTPDANPAQTKVFVPKNVFLELFQRANPEKNSEAGENPNMEDRQNVALASAGATASGGVHPERLIDGVITGPGKVIQDDVEGYAWGLCRKSPEATFVIQWPKPIDVDRLRLQLLDQPGRYVRYKIELSEDGTRYTTLVERTQGRYQGWQTESFSRRKAKSIRLTGTFVSAEDGRFCVGEIEVLTPPTPVRVALGNATYVMTVNDQTYLCKGTLDIVTFESTGWAKVPLDFGPSRVVSLSLDGQPASIAHAGGVPFVQIQGAGKHTLDVELQGPLTLSPGRAKVDAQLVGGAATRLTVILPKGVEIDSKSLPSGAWIEKTEDGAAQRCEIDLGGGTNRVLVAWQSADIRGKGISQIASNSYMQLQLGPDGYAIIRAERVSIDGSPLDQLSFKIIGNWEIATVAAADLAEWTVSGDGDERRLRLWFQKPISHSVIQINGWAPLGSEPLQVAALSLENALRQNGFIGLQHGFGRRFTASSLEGLKRSSTQDLAGQFTLPNENLPDRVYHTHEPAVNARVTAELDPSQVSIETQIVGVILPQRLLASARSRYAATGRTPLRHEVEMPAGWDVRTVRCNAMRTWEIVEKDGKRRLIVYFNSRAAQGTEVVWSAEFRLEFPNKTLALDLPLPRCIADGKTTESIEWVLAADQSLALSQGSGTSMNPVPIERAPQWVRLEDRQSYRFAFRSTKPESKLIIDVSRQSSLAHAIVVSFIRAAEDYVQINARIRLKIEQAGRDRFTVKLPRGAALVSLGARNLRSRQVVDKPDGARVTVLLQSLVSGEQIIDLAFRMPRLPGQDVTVEGIVIEDAEVKQTEHYVGVIQAERGLVTVSARKGLNKVLDSEELPFVPEKISKSALAYAYAAESEWSMILRQPDVKVETGLAAEVSLAVIQTVIAADGGVRSVATYTIRNRALQFLKVEMPSDASLWGVLVDGQPVTVSHEQLGGAKILLVPIQRMGLTDLPIEVSVVYESARIPLPAAYLTYSPLAPKVLDMPVVQTYWQLYVPDDYEASRSGGNVKDVAASVLVGGKLTSNINEVERLVKIADNADSTYQRRKALRNLARKQQELNDNATVLNNVGQSIQSDELKRIGRDELALQFQGNSGVQQQAQVWQGKLNERSKDLEEAVAGAADVEQQQAFLDNYNFLENGWRGGQRFAKGAAEPKRPSVGEVPLADMVNARRFEGFRKGELPPAPAANITQQNEPLPLDGGLREGANSQFLMEKGSADLRVIEKGTRLTFRRVEGHPELTITLRSKTSSWRYGSLVVLLVIGLAFGVSRWKRAK